ncbi:Wzz/FepE/Etk N-terminal domain-containing protein [Pseudomonas sp. PvP006]|uniref:Wzz/FepE/Etk N-terminal domain-containing protein n=2 Tax=Pseudomonas TaxID=286 RepID=UPI001B7B2274|nr:LPS O-antigen subunit length determinant protein (WzzB/FepE family) [Pseudomonas sp. PvP025]MDQ0397443.1 LPS O-antigen subunit length determinant protein (WzzB/FepE family) [Pseudomonas sp. PvP006]
MSSSLRVIPVPPAEKFGLEMLFHGLWQNKVLIFAVVVLAGALSAVYAFLVTPEYQVTSVLRPAAINELDALNRSEVYTLPPAQALIKVGEALESYDIRLGFFRSHQNLFKAFSRPGRTLEQSFEEFNKNSINLEVPDSKKSDELSNYIKLEMTYPKGIDGVSILNGFVEYAINAQRQQIAADLSVIVKNRLTEIEGKLSAARSSYEMDKEARIAKLAEKDVLRRAQLQDELKALRAQLKAARSDRLALLGESIAIAKSLGIQKPSTLSSLGDKSNNRSSSVIRTEINNQQLPLYFMGVEALEAERSALLQRKSDDFTDVRIAQIAKDLQLLQSNREIELLNNRKNEDLFLSNVAPLRGEQARLRSLNLDMAQLKLVVIDKLALEPIKPIKPKKALILLSGLIMGGVLGVLIALARSLLLIKRSAAVGRSSHSPPVHAEVEKSER